MRPTTASLPGLAIAAAFMAAAMSPSLLPRHWTFQLVVTGVVTASGYGLGALLGWLWRRLSDREAAPAVERSAWRAVTALAPIAVAVMWFLGVGWQRELHMLMSMPAPSAWGYLVAAAGGLLLAGAIVFAARGIRAAARLAGEALARFLPRRAASPLAGLLVVILLIGVLDGVVIRGLFGAADNAFRLTDRAVSEEIGPPSSPLRSGSPASAVAWEDLGSKGRAFVTGGPSRRQIAAFNGGPAAEPIRVYAGLTSAPTIQERARLVVEELERTEAFEREVLVVVTPTGTGWVDPHAAAAIEYIWSGDTALAALQYSYLPSWLSFLVDSARAREAGRVLFETVYERWAELPEGDRPLLLVFGESLGADGSEAAFSGLADIRNRVDGALWVGPPNFSELWSKFTAERDPGSLQRLPVYDGGTTVRFAAEPEDLFAVDAPWPRPRVVYLQYASDPVVWWSPRLALRRPEWPSEPPGRDVLPEVTWYPLVTFMQLTADLTTALDAPAGHGHNYANLVADGWAAVASPPGWTDDDTDRLRVELQLEVQSSKGG